MEMPPNDDGTEIELPPGLKALKDEMEDLQDARSVADAAEPTEIINPATGEPVKHLRLRLGAADTRRVMRMPIALRATMAESILAERTMLKRRKRVDEAKAKKIRADRKRKKQLRRKNR